MLTHKFDFGKIIELIPCWGWNELKFGLLKNIISKSDIVYYANNILAEGIEDFDLVLKMSIADEYEVDDILMHLSEYEGEQEEPSCKKWIFALVFYAYSYCRSNVFKVIEDIYSEFGYPEELNKLIGYMPCEDGYPMDDKLEEFIAKNTYR